MGKNKKKAAKPAVKKVTPKPLVVEVEPALLPSNEPVKVVLKGIEATINKTGYDPKNRIVYLREHTEGFEVWKDGIPDTYQVFTQDENSEEDAEAYFNHLVNCSQN